MFFKRGDRVRIRPTGSLPEQFGVVSEDQKLLEIVKVQLEESFRSPVGNDDDGVRTFWMRYIEKRGDGE